MVSKLGEFRENPGNPGSVVQLWEIPSEFSVPRVKKLCDRTLAYLQASFDRYIAFLIAIYKTPPSKTIRFLFSDFSSEYQLDLGTTSSIPAWIEIGPNLAPRVSRNGAGISI